jgi:hypothetical protein
MKTIISNYLFVLFALLTIVSCNSKNNQQFRSNITGKAGELVVVISKNAWDSTPGEILRKTLGQPQLSLPQEEPIFNLIDIPHDALGNIFKTSRNLIMTKISNLVEDPGVVFKNDMWATPQATVEIKAQNYTEFEKLVNENSEKIISYFLQAEQNRLKNSYRKTHELTILNTLKEKYKMVMYCPPGFKIVKQVDDFIWFRYDTPEITQAVFVYTFKYDNDSAFTPGVLIQKRDEMLKKYVPGPTEGSYMATEKRIDPVAVIFTHNGNYASELRGLWRVENDFMGGPYILVAELDAASQRVVVADGFVYAPSKNQRNLLRQVEAMIFSMEFTDQEENNKINSQIKMGN